MTQSDVLEETISEKSIKKRVSEMATEIEKDHRGKTLLTVSVLKGSVIFTADLVREINLPLEMAFIAVSSYGDGSVSTGQLRVISDVDRPIEGREILIIEDIIDTGYTMKHLKNRFFEKGASNVRVCALLDKPSRRKVPVEADYAGFIIEDYFAVGYGLDAGNKYRNLKNICKLRS